MTFGMRYWRDATFRPVTIGVIAHELCDSRLPPFHRPRLRERQGNDNVVEDSPLIEQEANLCIPVARLMPHANLYDLGLTPFDAIRLLLAIDMALDAVQALQVTAEHMRAAA